MPRLMHPEHGWHVPINSHEEAELRTRGWVDDDGKALAAKTSPPTAVEPEKPRKPGRPKKV